MAEVANRDELEQELKAALAEVWALFARVSDPSRLDEDRLVELLETYCKDILQRVWLAGHDSLYSKYGAQSKQFNPFSQQITKELKQEKVVDTFAGYFTMWARDLAGRWMTRVRDWVSGWDKTEQEPVRPPAPKPSWKPTGGNPKPSDIHRPTVTPLEPEPEPEPPKIKRPHWREVRDIVLRDSDIERESADGVTDSNTHGEKSAADWIKSEGGVTLIAIWKCEPGACPRCKPLDNRPPNFWRRYAPNGPKLHPNCRCWLLWVPMVGDE